MRKHTYDYTHWFKMTYFLVKIENTTRMKTLTTSIHHCAGGVLQCITVALSYWLGRNEALGLAHPQKERLSKCMDTAGGRSCSLGQLKCHHFNACALQNTVLTYGLQTKNKHLYSPKTGSRRDLSAYIRPSAT